MIKVRTKYDGKSPKFYNIPKGFQIQQTLMQFKLGTILDLGILYMLA